MNANADKLGNWLDDANNNMAYELSCNRFK